MPPERPDAVSRPARPRVEGGAERRVERGGPPVPTLREAAREAVAHTSVRAVAEAVGMSSSGLHSFLNGGRPYARTIRLLAAWFVRQHGARGVDPTGDGEKLTAAADAAVTLLVEHLPPADRARAAGQVVAAIRALTDEARVPRPAWLRGDGPAE